MHSLPCTKTSCFRCSYRNLGGLTTVEPKKWCFNPANSGNGSSWQLWIPPCLPTFTVPHPAQPARPARQKLRRIIISTFRHSDTTARSWGLLASFCTSSCGSSPASADPQIDISTSEQTSEQTNLVAPNRRGIQQVHLRNWGQVAKCRCLNWISLRSYRSYRSYCSQSAANFSGPNYGATTGGDRNFLEGFTARDIHKHLTWWIRHPRSL